MNILILNWRDPKSPLAGGAEKLNFHILEPFIKKGDKVIWFAKSEKNLPKKDFYKGIEIIRFGNLVTYLASIPFFLAYKRFGKVEFVFDCIHGVGNFTPFFMPRTKKKIIIYEVAQNIWDEMFPFPINLFGKTVERLMFVLIYSSSKFWTISKSTADDLIKMGIKSDNIEILPMGFDAPGDIKKSQKYKNPTALFVGRLVDMKGVKDAIKSIGIANKDSKTKWSLNIIGRGSQDYEAALKRIVNEKKIDKAINFMGFVPEAEKFEEMSRAWVLLVPSSREGWGMIVGEANYAGTQIIGYNSPGLRDSIPFYSMQNKVVNGYEEMAQQLLKINRPVKLLSKSKPGWSLLQQDVIKNFEN